MGKRGSVGGSPHLAAGVSPEMDVGGLRSMEWGVGSILFSLGLSMLASLALVVVPQGCTYTLERFGRFRKILTPGIHIRIPFVDRVRHKISTRETYLTIPHQEVISKDNARLSIDAIAFLSVYSPENAAYAVEDYLGSVRALAKNNIRTVLGSMEVDEILSHREAINAQLLSVLNEATKLWGVNITRVEIQDVTPPEDLLEAMSQQLKAERHRRACILMAEGERESAVRQADASKYRAFAEAEALLRTAEARAQAMGQLAAVCGPGSARAINYLLAEQYIQAMNALGRSTNSKLVLMPMEATSLAGALAGIQSLWKSGGFDERASPPPNGAPLPNEDPEVRQDQGPQGGLGLKQDSYK